MDSFNDREELLLPTKEEEVGKDKQDRIYPLLEETSGAEEQQSTEDRDQGFEHSLVDDRARDIKVMKHLGILVITILLIICVVKLMSPSRGKVNKWIATKNYQKLDAFLERGERLYKNTGGKRNVYLYAVQKAAIHDASRYGDRFIMCLDDASDYERTYLLRLAMDAAFSPEQLQEILLLITTNSISRSDNNLLNAIDGILSKRPVAEADSILHVALARIQGTSNDVKTLVSNTLLFSFFHKEAYPKFYDVYRMISSCGELISNFKTVDAQLTNSQSRLDRLEASLAEKVERNRESFMLDCWIVAQAANGKYEIIVDTWSGIGRAYLQTLFTEFSSRGNTRIRVFHHGYERVSVREEFGGFNQSWPVFLEDVGYDVRRESISTLRNDIWELKESMRTLRNAKEDSQRALDEVTVTIFQIFDKYRQGLRSYIPKDIGPAPIR